MLGLQDRINHKNKGNTKDIEQHELELRNFENDAEDIGTRPDSVSEQRGPFDHLQGLPAVSFVRGSFSKISASSSEKEKKQIR